MVTTISDCEKIQNEGKKIIKKKKGVEFIYVSEQSLWERIHRPTVSSVDWCGPSDAAYDGQN